MKRTLRHSAYLGSLLLVGGAGDAWAGMPMVLLSALATRRIEAISFFAVVVLLVAWGVKGLWNGLRLDFPAMPRLSYRRALGLVVLLGLAFNLVLVMISGARELMTPGAWERNGATYRLSED